MRLPDGLSDMRLVHEYVYRRVTYSSRLLLASRANQAQYTYHTYLVCTRALLDSLLHR